MNWRLAIKNRWVSSPQWLRAAMAVAAIGGLVVLWTAWGMAFPESREPLFAGQRLRDSELTALKAAFAKRNLDDWECEQGELTIPRSKRNAYLQAAAKAKALPADLHTPVDGALSSTLLDTREVREEKRRQALQAELVRLVQALRGIKEATVRYSEHTVSGLRRHVERRALVAVRADSQRPLSRSQMDAIQQTVVAAVAGLQPEDVTVTDLDHATAYRAPRVAAPDRVVQRTAAPGRDVHGVRDLYGEPLAQRLTQHLQERLAGFEAVALHVAPAPLASRSMQAPAYRPVVHVQNEDAQVSNITVRLSAPLGTLRQHFGPLASSDEQLPQVAAEQLHPLIQQVTRRPTTVCVSLTPQESFQHRDKTPPNSRNAPKDQSVQAAVEARRVAGFDRRDKRLIPLELGHRLHRAAAYRMVRPPRSAASLR